MEAIVSDDPGTVSNGREAVTEFRSLDGLRLSATWTFPSTAANSAAVLVHGGGVTRDEGGFFSRLAAGLYQAGIASLRFDLRGHGSSEGRQEDLTLAGIMNDIRAAVAHVRDLNGDGPVSLIGMSFGGGISGYFASRHPDQIRRLVLLNPLVNYKKRFIDDKPYWNDDRIDDAAGRELAMQGFLWHSPTFKLGRPLLNEVFYLQPDQAVANISRPTLIVHGTKDTFVPVESSRMYVRQIRSEARLLEVEGAQHGFAVHDDPQYLNPQTVEWQSFVIRSVAEWLA
jgi:hypothetical protein